MFDDFAITSNADHYSPSFVPLGHTEVLSQAWVDGGACSLLPFRNSKDVLRIGVVKLGLAWCKDAQEQQRWSFVPNQSQATRSPCSSIALSIQPYAVNKQLRHVSHRSSNGFTACLRRGKFRSGASSEKIFDISGTAIYQAPEMIKGEGHGRAVDWWALGVLAYVLMAGRPPFSSDSREELTRKIAEEELNLEDDERLTEVSDSCKDLIKRLLDKNPATRLGHGGPDAKDVQKHPFFAGIDWSSVEKFKLTPPLSPALEKSTEPNNPQDIKQANKSLAEKIMRKHKSDGGMLDEGEYKPVQVNKFPTSNRVSIGLDFSGRNKMQRGKTWTGTIDDFGREITGAQQ
ncbi:unnamed protein product [Agarophyton chilense]